MFMATTFFPVSSVHLRCESKNAKSEGEIWACIEDNSRGKHVLCVRDQNTEGKGKNV